MQLDKASFNLLFNPLNCHQKLLASFNSRCHLPRQGYHSSMSFKTIIGSLIRRLSHLHSSTMHFKLTAWICKDLTSLWVALVDIHLLRIIRVIVPTSLMLKQLPWCDSKSRCIIQKASTKHQLTSFLLGSQVTAHMRNLISSTEINRHLCIQS